MSNMRKCPLISEDGSSQPIPHRGAACEDPECLFRRAVTRTSHHETTPFADAIRARARTAALAMRLALGLPIGEKGKYVRAETRFPSPRPHFCHVPGCKSEVHPAYLMCRPHWKKVPAELQRQVWQAFSPGQEKGQTAVTPEYLAAAKAAIAAVVGSAEPPRHEPQLSLFGTALETPK